MTNIRRRVLLLTASAIVSASAVGFGVHSALGDILFNAVPLPGPAASPKVLPPDPEAGLTDVQKEALHQQARSTFVTRYTAWLNTLNIAALDLHGLRRYDLNADVLPGQPTLTAAVQQAGLVVVGTVMAITPTTFSGTNTTLGVDQVVKGTTQSPLTNNQGGGLRPTLDWTGVTIADEPGSPLLLPGDRAILFLQVDNLGRLYIQSVSGWYQVTGGLVTASAGNPFASSVTGKTEATFIQQIQSASR
jgi:hypothetical protein